MSTLFIFIFLLITIFFSMISYKKTSFFFAFITLAGFIIIGYGFLPTYLLDHLQKPINQENKHSCIQNHWKKNNTILILGAGTVQMPRSHETIPSFLSFSRLVTAVQLYRDCRTTKASCHILISGGGLLLNQKTEAATYKDILLSLGVNPIDIQLEPKSKNTYQNAKFTNYLLKQQIIDCLLLVSSAFSLKRALLYFAHFHVYPTPIPADFISIHLSNIPLGYHFAMTDLALHEYMGMARFYLYNLLGWNKTT